MIPANGTLSVERPANFPFGISCDDTIRLADATETLVDETTIGTRNSPTDTWGRYPNGAGPFGPTLATRNAPNEPAPGAGPPPDLAGWMYDPATMVEVDLELPPASIDALDADPEEYVDGTFSLNTTDGSYGPLQIGVRLKGQGSFRPLSGKAAFKLKFSHSVPGQRFLGLKGMTLNNMVQDPSMIHETLTFALHRAAGVPAPRTGYSFVRVNGDAYGVYLNIENVDEIMLRRHFATTKHLYEGSTAPT